MCLLVALSRVRTDAPLVIAANRDEHLSRPAVAMTVLREAGPRIVGGRDLLAGGTWMAVSERGVVAALTNVPSPSGHAPNKRSRGELPLRLAQHATAAEAAAAFVREVDPADYNPCWLLVGDRVGLYYFDLLGGRPLIPRALPPGVHVLENQPLEPTSIKAAFVRDRVLATLPGADAPAEALVEPLRALLASHDAPPALTDEVRAAQPFRPLETWAACVHAGDVYGTRTGAVVIVPAAPARPPAVRYTEGPPCAAPLLDATDRWAGP